ncbi:hypothetical protein TNCV_1708931 [Trichonephila clavipes]|nr:hypothetical protein TNCV_1708931 [Trichonephila clavipes]
MSVAKSPHVTEKCNVNIHSLTHLKLYKGSSGDGPRNFETLSSGHDNFQTYNPSSKPPYRNIVDRSSAGF